MRLAVIDIGSNTIKVTVFDAARTLNEVYSRSISAKLSAHTVDGVLSENGIRTLCLAVNELKRTARRFFCKKQRIFAFATACVRGAKNRDEILRIAEKVTRMKINLLSGEEEAELCFLGALASSGCPRSGVLADLGGGSCEFIRFEDRMATDRVSLNIGALSTYKKFASQRFLSKSETEELRLFVNRELEPYRARITLPSGGVFAVQEEAPRRRLKYSH